LNAFGHSTSGSARNSRYRAGAQTPRRRRTSNPAAPVRSAAPKLADSERELILRALEAARWRIKGPKSVAAALDLHPSTLYNRMKKLGIQPSGPAEDGSE